MTFQFHTCRQSNALKNKTLLHFSQVLLCSLAPLLPRIFSCLPRSSRLSFSLSLSLCLLSLSVCLSFALSSCRVHTVQCVLFLNEAFFSCSQPVSFAEARPQLADCGWTVAMLIHRENPELAPERERETERKRWDRKTYSGTVEVIVAKDVLWLENKEQIQIGFSYFSLFFLWRRALSLWNIAQPILYDYKAGSWESYSISLNDLL